MKLTLSKLLLAIALLFTLGITQTFAQFRDSDDEIYFYKCPGGHNSAKVFNFDGKKATDFNVLTILKVQSDLKSDINYYENKVYSATYNLEYSAESSNSSWVVYYYKRWYDLGGSESHYFYFSKDRKKMIEKTYSSVTATSGTSSYQTEYELVEKSDFHDGRSRSSQKKGVIYE